MTGETFRPRVGHTICDCPRRSGLRGNPMPLSFAADILPLFRDERSANTWLGLFSPVCFPIQVKRVRRWIPGANSTIRFAPSLEPEVSPTRLHYTSAKACSFLCLCGHIIRMPKDT